MFNDLNKGCVMKGRKNIFLMHNIFLNKTSVVRRRGLDMSEAKEHFFIDCFPYLKKYR